METLIKILLPTLLLMGTMTAKAACDSPIVRTNAGANTVLTSTKYNTDLNTVYTAANTVDGSCLVDATVTSAKLDASDLGVILKSGHRGCKANFSDVNTISVSDCILAIGSGALVETTSATTVTWGCSGCSAEAASTQYYLYAKTTSNGTTLELLISTSAPAEDTGLDGSGNVALARFYNNASSDIDQYSIDQWHINKFIPQDTGWVSDGTLTVTGVTTDPTKGTNSVDRVIWRRDGINMIAKYEYRQTGAGTAGSGDYLYEIPNSYSVDTTIFSADTSNIGSVPQDADTPKSAGLGEGWIAIDSSSRGMLHVMLYDATNVRLSSAAVFTANFFQSSSSFTYAEINWGLGFTIRVPIVGWND